MELDRLSESNAHSISHKVVPVNDNGRYRLESSDTLKTSSSYRTIPLNDNFCDYLIERGYGEYVCVNELGNILNPNYITRKFKELLQDNGLRVIRLHDLRHSCASLLLHLGYNMKDIQLWLGHGDIGTTMNIYAHVEASRKISMLDGIQNAVRKL